MESKHLVVERMGEYFVKVYWNDNPKEIVWAGLEDTWKESLDAYKVHEPDKFSLNHFFGYDIVYK